ncbi:MAG: DUF2281 domain-containing protein [Oscillospiraceae bacterium]|nr:DUF2281 domain-containing protein [Oscillospiraceae bacterium]
MSGKQFLIREIESLPPNIIDEVCRYISFLKFKTALPDDITLASEQSLAKDWLLPEEDAAWANL